MKKIDPDKGWKTILGFVILGAGGILYALAGTEYAVTDQATAIIVISAGVGLAGIGERDAKAKQIKAAKSVSTTVEAWTQTVARIARGAGVLPPTKRKRGK